MVFVTQGASNVMADWGATYMNRLIEAAREWDDNGELDRPVRFASLYDLSENRSLEVFERFEWANDHFDAEQYTREQVEENGLTIWLNSATIPLNTNCDYARRVHPFFRNEQAVNESRAVETYELASVNTVGENGEVPLWLPMADEGNPTVAEGYAHRTTLTPEVVEVNGNTVSGIQFGEVTPNHIFLWSPNAFRRSTRGWVDWSEVLRNFISQTEGIDTEAWRALAQERREAAIMAAFERVAVHQCSHIIENSLNAMSQAQATVTRREDELQAARSAFERATLEHKVARANTMTEEDALEKLKLTFENLKQHPDIDEIRATDSRLTVLTNELQLTDPASGDSCVLGKCEIRVPLVLGNAIVVRNLTNKQGQWDHPHVQEGRPCFGDMSRTFQDMIQKLDIGPLVTMMIVLLKSFNPDDSWGFNANLFFGRDVVNTDRNEE